MRVLIIASSFKSSLLFNQFLSARASVIKYQHFLKHLPIPIIRSHPNNPGQMLTKQSKREKKAVKISCKEEQQLNNSGRSTHYRDSRSAKTSLRLPDIGSYQMKAPTARIEKSLLPQSSQQAQQSKVAQTIPDPKHSSLTEKDLLKLLKQLLNSREASISRESSTETRHEKQPEGTTVQEKEQDFNRYYSEQYIRNQIWKKLQKTRDIGSDFWVKFILKSTLLKTNRYKNTRNYETLLKVISDIEDYRKSCIQQENKSSDSSSHQKQEKKSNIKSNKNINLQPAGLAWCLIQTLKDKSAYQIKESRSSDFLELIKKTGRFKGRRNKVKDSQLITYLMSGMIAVSLASEGEQAHHYKWEGMGNFRLPPLQETVAAKSRKVGYKITIILIQTFRSDRNKEWWSLSELFDAIHNTNFNAMNQIVNMLESLRLVRRKRGAEKKLLAWNVSKQHERLRGQALWDALNSGDDQDE